MRTCRFLLDGHIHYGVVEDRDGELWIAAMAPAPQEVYLHRKQHGRSYHDGFSFEPGPMSGFELLPAAIPSKIVCVGRNYRDHVKELGHELPTEPLLFLKPPSSPRAASFECQESPNG